MVQRAQKEFPTETTPKRLWTQTRWAHEIGTVEQGCLLLAHESLQGTFWQTVVLILEHDDETGTVGIVLNRPTKKRIAALPGLGKDMVNTLGACTVYYGGPVGGNEMTVLHSVAQAQASSTTPALMFSCRHAGAVAALHRVRCGSQPAGVVRISLHVADTVYALLLYCKLQDSEEIAPKIFVGGFSDLLELAKQLLPSANLLMSETVMQHLPSWDTGLDSSAALPFKRHCKQSAIVPAATPRAASYSCSYPSACSEWLTLLTATVPATVPAPTAVCDKQGAVKSSSLRLAHGHAAWGPGQLARELKSNTWYMAAASPELITTPLPTADRAPTMPTISMWKQQHGALLEAASVYKRAQCSMALLPSNALQHAVLELMGGDYSKVAKRNA
eukprot:9756-Heterococcus_DN1.PRE.1